MQLFGNGSSRLDTTLRPICFGIDKAVTKTIAGSVGPVKFKRYEHILYIMAQLSRIVYCDTGIMWYVIEKSLGMSNDIVNKIITQYDRIYLGERRKPVTSQLGPPTTMESYSLKPGSGQNKYATYISTHEDMTCLFINASKLNKRPNLNSILGSKDVIVSFKGSSTAANFKHDLMSQFTSEDIGTILDKGGLNIKVADGSNNNYVTGAFVYPLVHAWNVLTRALTEHCSTPESRLFLTGHSLGGAYCSLFGFILAEAKVNGAAYMNNIKSIHIVSFGAPTILGDNARNTFNRHLDNGLVTVDRVVSQKVPARSASTQILVGGPAGPNNVIPTIPARFSHPGFRPLATEIRPEAGGRPYSIENIRSFYGAPSKTRYREPTTWPFPENMALGDRKMKAELANIVGNTLKIQSTDVMEEGDVVMPKDLAVPIEEGDENPGPPEGQLGNPPLQKGGLGFTEAKRIYDKQTMEHLPNFISVAGSAYAFAFAHAEYLGMFFAGGFRAPGMKNPANKNTGTAYFALGDDGVMFEYVTTTGGRRKTLKGRRKNIRKNKKYSRRRI
uniref:Fungal lipase-type domain-containing protein n=1 Tax=viral metagenome TaxID=1070528 RepID=A0A6C0K4V0_9ZZZZ